MKRVSFLLLAVLLVLTLSVPGSALADSGTPPTWNSTIYYYNPGSATGSMGMTFVNTGVGTTPGEIDNIPLPGHAFGEVNVGSTGDYKGAAMISADVPLVAVYKQFDAGGGNYAPVLYSSFDASQSGTGDFYLPSVLHSGYYVSKVGIQNVESEQVKLTLHFIDATGNEKATALPDKILDSQGSWMFQILDDAADVPGIGSSFDGSLVIHAVKVNGGGHARVVAAVEDLQSQGQRSYAYEGSGVSAKAFYLPYANCRYSTNQQSTTFYVQNAGSSPATINVYYYSTTGAGITYYTPTAKVAKGARMAVSACDTKVYAKMNGKNGTARITSDQPLVVIGKATSTDGLSTAFAGLAAGSTHIVLPYVKFSKLSSGERTTLSIMNVGSPATSVYINYYYQKSPGVYAAQKVVLATTSAPLAKYGKYSATPKVSGAALDANGDYWGAAEVVSNQPVVVVVRISQTVTGIPGILTLGEDYTGVPCGVACQ